MRRIVDSRMIDSRISYGRIQSAAILCAALAMLAVGLFAVTARAHAQSAGRVAGQILNGTAGAPASSMAQLDVTLFQMSTAGPVTHTMQTDAQGRFAFDNLTLDPSLPLFANVSYQGIQYFSDILTPDVATSRPLTMTVYETEPLPSNFQIDRTHLILDVGQKLLSGVELVQVTNSTDRAFMLPLPLPENTSDVEFNDPRDQFRAVHAAGGSISFPVLPTTTQILLGVQMSTHPPDYALTFHSTSPIQGLNILVAQTGGVQVTSAQLTPGAPFTPQGTDPSQPATTYSQLNGLNIPANSNVAVSISNLPGADNSGLIRSVVLGAGGLAALSLLGLALFRKQQETGSAGTGAAGVRLAQLKALAALDDAFEAGEIDERDYLEQRADIKAELMQAGEEQDAETRGCPNTARASGDAEMEKQSDTVEEKRM